MSESDEQKIKKFKKEIEDEYYTESSQNSNNEGTQSTYIILSDDELVSEGTNDSTEQLDYFASSSSDEVEEVSEVAWADSNENNESNDELQNDAPWLNCEGLSRNIEKQSRRIQFKFTRRVFTARCKIKLFKIFPHVKVLIDSFNIIYMIKNFEDFKTFKIALYKITDICYFNGKILLSSNSSSYMKEISVDGNVIDIKKGTGNIHKMITDGSQLYLLADKLFSLNKNLSIKNEFNSTFKDICLLDKNVVCLKENGDVYFFDKDLNFIQKHSVSFKFQFDRIFSVKDNIFVGTDNGLIIFDCNFKQIKSFSNLSEPISCLSSNNEFIVHGSDNQNSLRILKDDDFKYYDKFPFAKIKINPITAMDIEDDTIYFTDSRFISALKINYI